MVTGEKETVITETTTKETIITETSTNEPLLNGAKGIAEELKELNKLIQVLLEDLKKHTWGA